MPSLFEYSEENFIFETRWKELQYSTFDKTLISKWTVLQGQNLYFKYKLHINDSKILPGKCKYLAQLNVARGSQRRKPVEVQTMKQMFDPTIFNFTKMDEGEILFKFVNTHRKNKSTDNYVAINVSPLGFGHSLLLPLLYQCLPQVMTQDSLLTAMELFLLSKSPALRMGFNGLCANASVNHLHYHLYYLEERMILETINVEHLSGPCYMLLSFPSKGFAFQLSKDQNIAVFVSNVFKLVNLLQESEVPHNMTITRGSGFQERNPGLLRDHIRVYVWARRPMGPNRDIYKFVGPALCELFGHLMIKTQENFDSLTEDYVTDVLTDQTEEPFQSIKERVKHLYEES